ncbi:MAG: DNA (cytosine-5-)-methyltransferase [Parcubacteria group bacterium]|jgi:DNA (cytosine-5)-methyltransferase 1
MKHLDLFSGIGGFAYAIDQVWPGAEHIFCDNDKFCQQVLKKHWPNSKIYGDIRAIRSRRFIADSDSDRCIGRGKKINTTKTNKQTQRNLKKYYAKINILTGGFPCQPFSQAGKRRGTEDDRYLWPEMLRVIRLTKPNWVIAENVRGLLTMQGGVVFEQVCLDLEDSGYEVQPFIIPAVAVNAPHRRDRIWFVAHAISDTADRKKKCGKLSEAADKQEQNGTQYGSSRQSLRTAFGERCKRFKKNESVAQDVGNAKSARQSSINERQGKAQYGRAGAGSDKCITPNAKSKRKGRLSSEKCGTAKWTVEQNESKGSEIRSEGKRCVGGVAYAESRKSGKQTKWQGWENFERRDWERIWIEVAAELCGVDDGLPAKLDGLELSKSRHRIERLKALGNAIVPHVAVEIMRAIKEADEGISNT